MRTPDYRCWGIKEKQYLKLHSIHLSTKRVIVSTFGRGGGNVSMFFSEVILEQYTGLKDENGTKIYEGDVVRYDAIDYEYYWDETLQGFNIRRADGNQRIYGSASYESVKYGRVVGNVHEGIDKKEEE